MLGVMFCGSYRRTLFDFRKHSKISIMMIYFSCDADKFSRSMQVTREEIRKLRSKLINDSRLDHARKQLMGQLAISRENNEHLMLTTGKSFLVFNRVDSLETIRKNLELITSNMLRDTANEIIDPAKLNTLIFE